VAIGDELSEEDAALSHGQTPELLAIHTENAALIQQALWALPPAFREVIVLKELEDLPYKDIALVVDIPIGTVMSRLARARAMLKLELLKLHDHE
jgi:RNA polymerase sigma-70 factor (ECF subfamily)